MSSPFPDVPRRQRDRLGLKILREDAGALQRRDHLPHLDAVCGERAGGGLRLACDPERECCPIGHGGRAAGAGRRSASVPSSSRLLPPGRGGRGRRPRARRKQRQRAWEHAGTSSASSSSTDGGLLRRRDRAASHVRRQQSRGVARDTAASVSGCGGDASLMKSAGAGGRGCLESRIETSSSERSPLRRLQGAHEVTTFSQTESPPRLFGTTWSSVSRTPLVPQYTHSQPSRAKRARREMRRWAARGTRTYVTRRTTCGQGNASSAERRGRSSASTSSARCLCRSTCARRTEQTFSGS